MDFVTDLMTTSTAELSNLELAVGGVFLAALGLFVGFVAYRLLVRAINEGDRRDIEDWYNNPDRWDD